MEIFDLSYCLKTALSQNPGLISAQDDVIISARRRAIATASLWPAVSVRADETRGKADQALNEPSFLQKSYGVQITQPLFSGGKLINERKRAARGTEIARLQLQKQRLDLEHAVAESYWRAAALEKSLSFYRETYGLLQEDLEKAVRHELGASRSARIELLSVRVQNRECESAILETEEDLLEARSDLLDAMGQKQAVPFRVVQDIPVGAIKVTEEEALRLARGNRPELKIAENIMQSALLGRKIGASGYLPRLDLNGFYGRSAAAFIDTDPLIYRKDWNAGARVSWAFLGNTARYSTFKEKTSPRLGESSRTQTESQSVSLTLGDALGYKVEAVEGRKAFNEEEWRYEKMKRDIDQEIHLAVSRVSFAKKRLEGANARLEEVKQIFKDTRSLLQEDRAHLGDMAQARLRSAQAQAAQAQSAAQYLTAVSALNRAIGIPNYYRVIQ